MSKTILPRCWYLILACVVILSGCSTLGIKPPHLPLTSQEEKPQQPATILAIWSDMVAQQPNGESVRGFGGRLTFYTAKGAKPVRVEGTLVVYGFEEAPEGAAVPPKVQPDQKYVFTPEQFAQHYEKTTLGSAYSVWIPWDAGGGTHKEVSLIARFTPKDGQLVVGEQTRHVLPGPPAPVTDKSQMAKTGRRGDGDVRQVSFQTPVSSGPDDGVAGQASNSHMQITTIDLTPELANQMMRSGGPLRLDRLSLNQAISAQQASNNGNPNPQAVAEAFARHAAATTGSAEPEPRQAEPRSGYSQPPQLRVPEGPIARLNHDRGPTPPSLGGWPSAGEPTPPAGSPPGAGPAWSTRPTSPDSSSARFATGW